MFIVETEDLVKRFGQHTAVDGVNLGIEEGKIFGLLGPNGAGKSTTINMICGLVSPSSGEVTLLGENIEKNKSRMGYVPQNYALYNDFTAYENLAFFGRLYKISGSALKQNINDALEFTGLLDVKNKKAKTFSGGMLRRLNIACALVHKPLVMIMDEPTVGIDPQSRNHIMDSIKKLNENGVTVIYTSHYMEEIEALCDQIAIMDYGKIITQGSKKELKDLVTDKVTLDIVVNDQSKVDLNKIKEIAGVSSVFSNDRSVQITSEKDTDNLNEILGCLLANGVRATNIGYKEVTLETVFLSLTGGKLRD
ncbi:ABC transporter ATP-binding protein [Paenibacillus polymyxa]|uniref:ABC transporter ATP-binding protein n=1 Tax=Paenibacillus polymyxa TaxID=1406 RepID=UPI003216283F